jgi:large subunit ribosomal protein L10
MDKKGRAEVRPEKIKLVEELASMFNKYPVVGILDMYKTPASALQKIKISLKGKAVIKVTKKSSIIFALEKVNKQNLKDYIKDYPGLIFSNEDPFKLYSLIIKENVPVPAKPGDIPKEDIKVKAGPTDLPPGPAISTLSKVKIPAKVEGGKIAVIKDKVVCKAGEPVSIDLASVLQMLKMEPMEAGLNVVVLQEKDAVYTSEQLFVDEVKLLSDIQTAVQNAFNLSMNAEIPTKQTIGFMLAKAQMEAKALETEVNTKAPKGEPKVEEVKAEDSKPEEAKQESSEEKTEPKVEEQPKEEKKTEESQEKS